MNATEIKRLKSLSIDPTVELTGATDAKLTRKQFDARVSELVDRAGQLEIEWQALSARMSAHVSAGELNAARRLGPQGNALADLQWEVREAQRALEDAWSTRNWTALDWQQWYLVAQNID